MNTENIINQALIDDAFFEELRARAVEITRRIYGNEVFMRALIEFTNYCKNDCYYCGIRCGNKRAVRYRMTKDEIMETCQDGYRLGFRTFVLQGGEDVYYNDDVMVDIVKEIKGSFFDCAVTLSLGERPADSYKKLRLAGADRYLLRHEAANEGLYKKLHPRNLSLDNRKKCLYNLKSLGYQTGAGFMVGAPGQTLKHLSDDLAFLKELNPHMVGIGPFIPHKDTIFAGEKAGTVRLTLIMLSLTRITLNHALLPATTALATLDGNGRSLGILSGANVVMPNLTPERYREHYNLYDNKKSSGSEAAENVKMLQSELQLIGYRPVSSRGDYK